MTSLELFNYHFQIQKSKSAVLLMNIIDLNFFLKVFIKVKILPKSFIFSDKKKCIIEVSDGFLEKSCVHYKVCTLNTSTPSCVRL